MSHSHPHRGAVLPQETDFDSGADQPGIAQPISQNEIEDLVYTDDRPVEERLDRLRELRDEVDARAQADRGEHDARDLLSALESAIESLSRDEANADDNDDYAGLDPAYESDPADHLDALSPDDEEGRDAIEGDDEDAGGEDARETSYEEDLDDLDRGVIEERRGK